MVPHLSFVGGLGGREILFLLFLANIVIPVWISLRVYRTEPHWRTISIISSILAGVIGFVIVRSIRAGSRGYLEGRTGRRPPGGP